MNKDIDLKYITIDDEGYYMISNNDAMNPFLMSIVSDSNHWMFISSNGGLSAGRRNADHALFPYYTDDMLSDLHDLTGSKSIFWICKANEEQLWEPFSERQMGKYGYHRNLYKNSLGNKIIFEEVNLDLGITFRYRWSSSDKYGFVRESFLINNNEENVEIRILDGIQNIMPYGVEAELQVKRSNLVNAYKRSELESETGLGIYALSAIIVDRAEPSEALKANIAWSVGVDNPEYLLSSKQLDDFRAGKAVQTETDVKAEKGAYFISARFELPSLQQNSWMIIADVDQGPSDVAEISAQLKNKKDLIDHLKHDVNQGSERLFNLVTGADGLQLTADKKANSRHYANTLFNIMRGGVFDDNYYIGNWDFKNYVARANKKVYENNEVLINEMSEKTTFQQLREIAFQNDDKDFTRLALEYLPLKFSRRHGDPSRPWNRFSINTKDEKSGGKILDYEGNWRDIFQNWEALAHAYPEFIESMILKFLNASTFDGYNPYRVTKDGFDWEVIEEHDPWSYIGYWGDHQIIYLLKFLEFIRDHYPERLLEYFNKDLFVYANVPYKIKTYAETLQNPKDTILFDADADLKIREERAQLGSDGALLCDKDGRILKVNFIEKILATALSKLSNFIPEAGIWMNTQRPEWNDANNALVGNGVSMVTLYYLRRFFHFIKTMLNSYDNSDEIFISRELYGFLNKIQDALIHNEHSLSGQISNKRRKEIMDRLGNAGSDYRNLVYLKAFSGEKSAINYNQLKDFTAIVLKYLDHSIDANRRPDKMYHAYNLMTVDNDNQVVITHLDEMLEGQVAVLSSGYLSASACLELLDAVKDSKLFRDDQYSYLLYPNKELPGFLSKNIIPVNTLEMSDLLKQFVADGNNDIIECDLNGQYHFNGNFKNVSDLKSALKELSEPQYVDLIKQEDELVQQIFESVFNHKAFTGRSGTFFGYEGLGSIYWHMVSKYLLAVAECCIHAIEKRGYDNVVGRLLDHFYEINEGIGVHKSPELYGAFPTDPYSHTPQGKGVQQPGMTGQVKEDILSRLIELGVFVKNGQIHFNPCLLRKSEFLKQEMLFNYIDVLHNRKSIPLGKNSIAFTYCQIPIVYQMSDIERLEINYSNGKSTKSEELLIDASTSQLVFGRGGEIECIKVFINKTHLK